jgi:hypothetical protein
MLTVNASDKPATIRRALHQDEGLSFCEQAR